MSQVAIKLEFKSGKIIQNIYDSNDIEITLDHVILKDEKIIDLFRTQANPYLNEVKYINVDVRPEYFKKICPDPKEGGCVNNHLANLVIRTF